MSGTSDGYDEFRKLRELIGEPLGVRPTLRELKKEAQGYGKRRADKAGSRDNLIYRAGYAIDALGGSDIDTVALTGVLSSALLLAEMMQRHVGTAMHTSLTVIDVCREAMTISHLATWAREEGAWLQYQRLRALVRAESERFNASTFADENAGWRRKWASPAQRYIVGEICRLTGIAEPVLRTRGEAYQFIADHGGNPRFKDDRPRPARPRI